VMDAGTGGSIFAFLLFSAFWKKERCKEQGVFFLGGGGVKFCVFFFFVIIDIHLHSDGSVWFGFSFFVICFYRTYRGIIGMGKVLTGTKRVSIDR